MPKRKNKPGEKAPESGKGFKRIPEVLDRAEIEKVKQGGEQDCKRREFGKLFEAKKDTEGTQKKHGKMPEITDKIDGENENEREKDDLTDQIGGVSHAANQS